MFFAKNVDTMIGDRQRLFNYIEGDSLALEPRNILAAVTSAPFRDGIIIGPNTCSTDRFRLFSIDGGHTVVHVLNDLRLVERVMVPGGVVIVDDFMHPKWPGVTEGLHIYCTDRASRLVPFAYGNNKMYLTTFEHGEAFRAALVDCSADIVKAAARVSLYGRRMTWIDFR